MKPEEAAKEVRSLLRGFKAVNEVAEALEMFGSIKNAEAEIVTRIEALRKEEIEARNSVLEKKEEAMAILEAARQEAKEIVQLATKKADESKESDQQRHAESLLKLEEMTGIANGKSYQLEQINLSIKTQQKILDEMLQKQSEIRARFAELSK